MRLGYDLPGDFGPPMVRPSRPGNDDFVNGRKGDEGFSLYGFVGVDGRVVGRNIFLDGNTFSDSHDVDKEYLVGDLNTGAVIQANYCLGLNFRCRLSYTLATRSPEFDGKDFTRYSAITLNLGTSF